MTNANATKQHRPEPAQSRKRKPLDLAATIKLMREMDAASRAPADTAPATAPPNLGLVPSATNSPVTQQSATPEPKAGSDLEKTMQNIKNLFSRKKHRAASTKTAPPQA